MKTRRIYLQPGECVEVINTYGTSLLKITARFKDAQPCVVIYEQPDVLNFNPASAKEHKVTVEPDIGDCTSEIVADLIEQNNLDI